MKHAFLILAHNNFNVLKSLLHQLDDKDFYIFIHINSKVKSFPEEELKKCVKNTNITFVKRVPVLYSEYSMVNGIISLMTEASQEYHDYYHIISGVDMMVKSRKYFKDFFVQNNGYEFVGFSKNFDLDRVLYKNYFISKARQSSHLKSVFFIKLRKQLINLQKILNIKNQIPYDVKKGTDWYSVTHHAVKYMLQEEPKFKKYFYYSYGPTEFLPQTLLWNSSFKDNLYLKDENEGLQCLRTIDWDRGHPYIFKLEDYDMLINSKGLFARKFDENTDMGIVEKLSKINDNRE